MHISFFILPAQEQDSCAPQLQPLSQFRASWCVTAQQAAAFLQAQEVMAPDADRRYASASVHIQVKLTEALDHCDSLSPPRAAEDGQLQPDRLRTAVCCKVRSPALGRHCCCQLQQLQLLRGAGSMSKLVSKLAVTVMVSRLACWGTEHQQQGIADPTKLLSRHLSFVAETLWFLPCSAGPGQLCSPPHNS